MQGHEIDDVDMNIMGEECDELLPMIEEEDEGYLVEDVESIGGHLPTVVNDNLEEKLATVKVSEAIQSSSKELAATIMDMIGAGGKIEQASNIAMAAIRKNTTNKKEALVFLYALVKQIAQHDSTGETSVSLLSSGIMQQLYKSYNESVFDTYSDVVPAGTVNSKAYLVDAFVNEYYPMYSDSIFEASQGMSSEMMYPDRFLNILFSAVRKAYLDDVDTIKNLANFYMKTNSSDADSINAELQSNLHAIEKQHKREDAMIMSLFSDKEKADMNLLFENKLREIFSQGVSTEALDEMKRIVSSIPEQIKDSFSANLLLKDAIDKNISATETLVERLDKGSDAGSSQLILDAIDNSTSTLLSAIQNIPSVSIPKAEHYDVSGDLNDDLPMLDLDDPIAESNSPSALPAPENDYTALLMEILTMQQTISKRIAGVEEKLDAFGEKLEVMGSIGESSHRIGSAVQDLTFAGKNIENRIEDLSELIKRDIDNASQLALKHNL